MEQRQETIGKCSYSPDDNKLRLYPFNRLEPDLYARVRANGFIWAPKQDLFVAPMWTPSREDFLIELCGEVGDEDTSLVDRAEQRAERFEDYSDNRRQDAEQAHAAVESITEHIPLGQPILVGHHSEKRARKDAERIENGMRKAVKMWETAQYWKSRAAGAIHAAKYKERPDVRARRIKKIESDQRRELKTRKESEAIIKRWSTLHDDALCGVKNKDGQAGTFLERARWFTGNTRAGYCGVCLKADAKPGGYDNHWSAADVLRPDGERYAGCPSMTPEDVQAAIIRAYTRTIERCDRWLTHYANRLEYERAMLADAGGTIADQNKPEKGGACRCWASPGYGNGWSYIVKVNKVSVTVLDSAYKWVRLMPFDKLKAIMSKAEVDAAREAGKIQELENKTGFFLMESREAFDAREAKTPEPTPQEPDQGEKFDALRDTLREGVKVVAVPQLFPTPQELARRMVQAAGIMAGHRVLEPSAGTGNIIRAILGDATGADCVHVEAIEVNPQLVEMLRTQREKTIYAKTDNFVIHSGDFLRFEVGMLTPFDYILMNPPFENGADIKHIEHARKFLKAGGRLVAICANGSRQNDRLKPICELWEELPADTFKEQGTSVRTALLVIHEPPAADESKAPDAAESAEPAAEPSNTQKPASGFNFEFMGGVSLNSQAENDAEADATRRAFGTKPPTKLKPAQQDNLFDPIPQGRLF